VLNSSAMQLVVDNITTRMLGLSFIFYILAEICTYFKGKKRDV